MRSAVARRGTANLGRAEPSEPGLGSVAVAAAAATIACHRAAMQSFLRVIGCVLRGFGAPSKCWKV